MVVIAEGIRPVLAKLVEWAQAWKFVKLDDLLQKRSREEEILLLAVRGEQVLILQHTEAVLHR